MNIDKYGRIELTEKESLDALYSNKINELKGLFFDKETVQKFNSALLANKDNFQKINTLIGVNESLELFDEANQCLWFMSEKYHSFPIESWLLSQCVTEEERIRVNKELKLFIQHDMFDLLFYLKYLIDTMREHKIVWGVGRGSSVASFVLYLLGVHRINSIKYELDIHEFLGEKNG
jgi:DNA polymerase III alpha subunit